ncbi:SpoIIE family protein phosphatase [candidate division KSB1 bacterium]|nr:SpoIIE family protein phosphatase [candidate division KSB1 bacterium]
MASLVNEYFSEKKSRILLVDDDPYARRLLMQYLKKTVHEIHSSENGNQAIEQIANLEFDLVITDLQMTPSSGLEVLEAAKQKNKYTQVLIITAHASIHSAVAAMKNGAFEYLTKPLDADAFLLKVQNALEHRHLQLLLQEQQTRLDQYHRMISRDLAIAKQVQSTLIPQAFDIDGLKTSMSYKPLIGLGGDWADIHYDQDRFVYLTIVDVTGHGIASALLVNRICSEINKWIREGIEPANLLFKVNDFFCRSFVQTGLFVTIMAVKVDLSNQTLRFAASAHPAALLVKESKEITELPSQNMIIGFEEKALDHFKETEVKWQQGDVLFMYTDGLVEAENELTQPLGMQGLKNIVKTMIFKCPKPEADDLVKAVHAFSHDGFEDDVLVLAARFG